MKANYEEDKVIVSTTEPTGVNRKKVWIKKGKNLIKQIILNSMCDSNGLIYNNQPNFARTDYIPIEHNVDYIFSHSLGSGTGYISTFDKNFNYLGKINAEEITTKFNISDINVKYIIISIWSLTIEEDTNIMLEQNSTATDYEQYIEPEIYILNSNNVYEKFEKNENKERILFESSYGISGDITLTDNITNYSYLEIYYKQNDGTYGYTKCVARNNTHIDLTVNHITNNGYANSFSSRTINLYNNAITTLNTNRYISGNITSDNNLSGTTATNNIYITKVVGYK